LVGGGRPVEHWLLRLQDRDPKTRKQAVTKLGNMLSEDPAARSAVVGALKDPHAAVRCDAVLALARAVDDPEVTQALEQAVRDKDAKVREFATRALKQK
jgi:HEAT repeat protein